MKFIRVIKAEKQEFSILVFRAVQPKMREYSNKRIGLNDQEAKELFIELVLNTRDNLDERIKNGTYEKRLQEYNNIDKSFTNYVKQQISPKDAINKFNKFMDENEHLVDEQINFIRKEDALQRKYKDQLDNLYSETHNNMVSMALVANDDDWKQVLDAHKNWKDLEIQHFNQMLEDNK